MKKYKISLLLIILAGSLLLSSCAGAISASSWPGLTMSGDTVYVSYATGVFAIRASDGQLAWRYPAEVNKSLAFYAAPAVVGDQIVVGDYSATLHGLDALSGTEKWTFKDAKGRWIANSYCNSDTILAPNGDQTLYALTLAGQLRWKFTTNQALWGSPVTNDTTVFIASMDHFLYALNITNGNEVWKADLGGAALYGPALGADGLLYVGTLGNEVLAIDSSSGAIQWRFKTTNQVWGTPILDEGSVYFGDLSGTIYAVDAQNGTQLWKVDAGGPVFGSAVVTPDGLVFNTENGKVVMVSTTGGVVWTQTIVGKLYTTPVFGNDQIVVAVTGGDNLLVALTLQGTQKWTYAPPK
jgi:outer membrane protein assembly factor BamB